jgi:CcmD family protein
MEKMTFLFLAYSAIWSGIFIFLLQIARRLGVMQKDLDAIKQEIKSR